MIFSNSITGLFLRGHVYLLLYEDRSYTFVVLDESWLARESPFLSFHTCKQIGIREMSN
jgi:hypothetical protein